MNPQEHRISRFVSVTSIQAKMLHRKSGQQNNSIIRSIVQEEEGKHRPMYDARNNSLFYIFLQY